MRWRCDRMEERAESRCGLPWADWAPKKAEPRCGQDRAGPEPERVLAALWCGSAKLVQGCATWSGVEVD